MPLSNSPEVINLTDIQKLRDECLRLSVENNMLIDARKADAHEYKRIYEANCTFHEKLKQVEEMYGVLVECNKCLHRWKALFPEGTDVTQLQCASCRSQDSKVVEKDNS